MSSTEDKVLEIIWDFGGEASVSTIAKEAKISPDYARLLCRNLLRNGYIDFSNFRICYLKNKGRLEAAKMKVGSASERKAVVPERPLKFGLGKNKKGRFLLDY